MVLKKIAQFLAGDSNATALKKAAVKLPIINELYDKYSIELTTEESFKQKTTEFKERIAGGETLDSLLPEAFALVKAAAKFICGRSWDVRGRDITWNMVHYDVQLLGGIVLHEGKITEMKTGEGKTLVCSLPIYLNALCGKGVYLVTVNDYLAQRDAEWMGGLYEFLGLSTGVVIPGQDFDTKKKMYECDIVYGTNNEFGFDYLRDNMATTKENVVQRNLYFAIVDEVDSILIDEARTPLIISAAAEESTKKYSQYKDLVKILKENEDYNIDEKQKVVTLTEDGIKKMENLLGIENIYTEGGFKEIHHIEQALKARAIFRRDVDYMVKDGEVLIVDEFTGRLMPGRRYSDGLHQAIEAKEDVEVQRESRTLATVTFQNYFRLFEKLAGMTGTAKTEEEEFYKIYGLQVVVIPTNRPVQRQDLSDLIFKSHQGKFLAVADKTKEVSATGQPVLIGTVSVEKSEMLSKVLSIKGVKHNVLNAKQHEKEAEIVAGAGNKGAVTIATNMAGRGTDIKLGEGVEELGGLYVVGTERHESRRIDHQLRGRSGRQGDRGYSQFYVSMDDDLMRIFGGDRVKRAMEALNMPEDMPITNGFITSSIESAQKRVEGRNFDVRKHIVEYDDVMNYHREIIYKRRKQILFEENIKNEILVLLEKEAEQVVLSHRMHDGTYDYVEILQVLKAYGIEFTASLELELSNILVTEDLILFVRKLTWERYEKLEASVATPELMRKIEREVYLSTIDTLWMEHIDDMMYLRQNVALHAYGQKDPLLEYKDRGYNMFQDLLSNVRSGVVSTLLKVQVN